MFPYRLNQTWMFDDEQAGVERQRSDCCLVVAAGVGEEGEEF